MGPPGDTSDHRIKRLESDVSGVKDDVGALKEAAVEHKVRLQNGSKVFEGWEKRISEVEDRTTPRPPSVYKVVGLTLALFMAAAGALWALAHMLRDRPTIEQLDRLLDRQAEHHEGVGHQSMRDDVRSIQKDQTTQGNQINKVVEEQAVHSEKLDQLLDRVPKPRRARPPR
ncbi:MAG: hypothetical protein KJO40_13535 [Deltaproteobacteria bacterium]|nr:hypothetical protein [Deltaproteobacteria bacterium]